MAYTTICTIIYMYTFSRTYFFLLILSYFMISLNFEYGKYIYIYICTRVITTRFHYSTVGYSTGNCFASLPHSYARTYDMSRELFVKRNRKPYTTKACAATDRQKLFCVEVSVGFPMILDDDWIRTVLTWSWWHDVIVVFDV